MNQDNFDRMIQRHSESYIWNILENWERQARVRHAHEMTLEDRWAYFIRATESVVAVAA